MKSIQRLSDDQLLEAYQMAKKLGLDETFLHLLQEEIMKRDRKMSLHVRKGGAETRKK
ncbi:sporulation histidine kinase inhibitor Sda [Melghiribacillus thermohalophilus]|uniref:sporulation histidine kinase inhibitor Sda n=1 Tax=Melghiribacillus thermohalophilus TaxID=1324956 RepID=UPI002437334E|nr:sporulation histidine kinase inhibitor Sda [Melghiribacillus thermohalophilus]